MTVTITDVLNVRYEIKSYGSMAKKSLVEAILCNDFNISKDVARQFTNKASCEEPITDSSGKIYPTLEKLKSSGLLTWNPNITKIQAFLN